MGSDKRQECIEEACTAWGPINVEDEYGKLPPRMGCRDLVRK
jgi:hypothetical protein